jgi:DNA-directed RNA polymerase subunit RPC12/RpoP
VADNGSICIDGVGPVRWADDPDRNISVQTGCLAMGYVAVQREGISGRGPCYSVIILVERRRLGFLTYAQEFSRSMASFSCSSQAGAQDNGPYPIIACPYCGSRILTRIASTGRRPGTRYYKCERYSVSSSPPSRCRFPSVSSTFFYAEIFLQLARPCTYRSFFPHFFRKNRVLCCCPDSLKFSQFFILPRAAIAVSLSGLRVTLVLD